jgi:hypothetical protein
MDRGGGTACVPSVFPVGTTGESEEEHAACRQPSDPSNSHRSPSVALPVSAVWDMSLPHLEAARAIVT